MRALLANLERFYRDGAVWRAYGAVGFVVLFNWLIVYVLTVISSPAEQEVLLLFVLAVFASATVVGGYEGLLLHPPFAACLPGHRTTVRRAIFLIGVFLGLAASLLLLRHLGQPLLPLSRSILLLESAFCLHLAIFLVGAGLAFTVFYASSIFVRCLAVSLFLAGYASTLFAHAWFGSLERLAPGHPVFTTILGGAAASFAWFFFGRPARLPHKSTGRDTWLARRPPETSRSVLSRLLLDRMHGSAYTSAAKYVWGALYAWQLRGGGARLESLWLVTLGLVSCVLARDFTMSGGSLVTMAVVFQMIRTHPLPATLLAAGGRRERFVTTMALIILPGAILMLTLTLTFVAMDLLKPLDIPQGTWLAEDLGSWRLHPMTLRLAILLTALFPISALLEFAWGQRSGCVAVGRGVLFLVGAGLAQFKVAWVMAVSPVYIAAAVLLAWLIATYGVYRVTMTRDLVRR
jgi:hypothetical protein